MSQKKEFWQVVRGLCIMAVIICHCPGIAKFESFSFDYLFFLVVRQIASFGVPVFLFISGYFVNPEKVMQKNVFFLTRFRRLAVPYFIWTCIYLLVGYIQFAQNGLTFPVSKMIVAFITGGATAPLYYIIVLLQLTLLTPFLLNHLKKNDWIKKLLWLISPMYLVLIYAYCWTEGKFPPFYNVPFFGWIFFYYLGLNLRHNPIFFKRVFSFFGKKEFLICGLVLCVFESMFLSAHNLVNFAISQMKFSSMLMSLIICLYVFVNGEKKCLDKLFISFGDCSYGIFYIHELVKKLAIFIISMFTSCLGFTIKFVLCFMITFLLSFVFIYLYRKWLKKFKISNFIFSSWV